MATEPAHFTKTEDGGYMPTRFALSHWGDDHLNGPAVVGLSAQVLETLSQSLTNKLMHAPTQALSRAAGEEQRALAETLERLFHLK